MGYASGTPRNGRKGKGMEDERRKEKEDGRERVKGISHTIPFLDLGRSASAVF